MRRRAGRSIQEFTRRSGCIRTKRRKSTPQTFDDLRALLEHPKVVAFGEIGLDYHYDFSPREVQREVFVEQLRSRGGGKPMIIHTREAWADTMDMLRREWTARHHALLHRRSGRRLAKPGPGLPSQLRRRGDVQQGRGRAAGRAIVPDDRLLVETDAPYLAPVPHRGKRNEPAFMMETVRKLAAVRGVDGRKHIAARRRPTNFERLCLRALADRTLNNSDGNRQAGAGI